MRGLRSTIALLAVLHRPRRLHLLRHFGRAGERDRPTQERVFAALDGDTIDELKVKSESGETTSVKKDGGDVAGDGAARRKGE